MDVEELPMHKDTYFFGYGIDIEKPDEMARQIIKLKEENQQLKKQLENCYCNRIDCAGRIKDSKLYDSLVQKIENQQKEFIEYLEKNINHYKEIIRSDRENNTEHDCRRFETRWATYEEVLSKYKGIVGGNNDQ